MRRAALAAPVAGVLAGMFGGAATLVPTAQPCAAAAFSSHVTLVVEHGDARVVGLCIGFDGATITGEQILQASGLQYATQSYGSLGDAVCQIDSEPTSYGSCLPSSGSYWAMFVSRTGGAWLNADRGISSETFSDGDAEGFRYDSQNGAEPPPASPAGICARALATPTAAPAVPTAIAGAPPPAQGAGSGTGSSGADAAGSATSAGSSSQPAAPSSAASQEPSVIRPAGSRGGVATVGALSARPASGPDAALIAACAGIASLAGLVLVRLLRRRRMGRT